MKTLRIFPFITLFLAVAGFCFAQTKTETMKVSGNCAICKKKIETAAKNAGAATALWNKDTKILTVKYNSSSTNQAKIQQNIADAGYDTPDFKAPDNAYNNLDACCQYERDAAKNDNMHCASTCEMKDGKCADMAACKDKGCCKDEASCKEKGCCSKEATTGNMMGASHKQEGKMAMSCGDSKSCCKKTQQ
jgi:periplasmic mercuric ion binding protein